MPTPNPELLACAESLKGEICRLDPSKIAFSAWCSRPGDEFDTAESASLAKELRLAGINTWPVKLCKLTTPTAEGETHEVIAGSLRVYFAQKFGWQEILAEEMGPLSLDECLAVAYADNVKPDTDVSPLAFGQFCIRMMKQLDITKQVSLAKKLGVDESIICKAIKIAKLPPVIIQLFCKAGYRHRLQYGDEKRLRKAMKADPGGPESRAQGFINLGRWDEVSREELLNVIAPVPESEKPKIEAIYEQDGEAKLAEYVQPSKAKCSIVFEEKMSIEVVTTITRLAYKLKAHMESHPDFLLDDDLRQFWHQATFVPKTVAGDSELVDIFLFSGSTAGGEKENAGRPHQEVVKNEMTVDDASVHDGH